MPLAKQSPSGRGMTMITGKSYGQAPSEGRPFSERDLSPRSCYPVTTATGAPRSAD